MPDSVDEFVRTILRSGVVDRERLKTALKRLPANERQRPEGLAETLVSTKVLTPFQAKKLLAGVTLGLRLGPYLIQHPIGKGGMGTVYLAKDIRNDASAAIKVLSRERLREGERHLVRFRREMELTKKMRHPNVAMARGFGQERGVHYLALEYIPGVTLYRLVTRDGPLAPPRAARLFAEICSALEHAHEQGLIHRDLKPTNIMVTPDHRAKVLDLGLALIEGEETDDPEVVGGQGYIVGSVEYIAPEQTRDPAQVDARADLYSLGCALYFALTGRGPFSYGTAKDKIRAHRQMKAEPIRNRNPAVPPGLADLIERLMAKNPADRPASAAAVRAELLAYGESSPNSDDNSPFELVDDEEFEDAPDTLGEAFRFEPQPGDDFGGFTGFGDDDATISRSAVRSRLAQRPSGGVHFGMVFAAVAVGLVAALIAAAILLFATR